MAAPASASFDSVTQVPPDPVFFVSQQYNACTAKIKLNLGVGAYRTNEGKPLVLSVVKKAEQIVADKLQNDTFNIECLLRTINVSFRFCNWPLILVYL